MRTLQRCESPLRRIGGSRKRVLVNVAIYAEPWVLSNPAFARIHLICHHPIFSFFNSEFQGILRLQKSLLVRLVCLFVGIVLGSTALNAGELSASRRGYDNLRTHQYLPPDFDDEVFADLWNVWPEPDHSAAEAADAKARRRLIFSYYGLMQAPDDPQETKPALGYVADGQGNWVMNCLACHGGKVMGKVIPGLPNSHTALQTLAEDVLAVKVKQGKVLTHLELGSLQIPLGTTNGTTNAVIFGVVLGAYRNPDMSVDLQRKLPPLAHHDMDAPPFWNVRKKQSLYVDGFSPKTPRPLMQFIMLPKVTPQRLTEWEPEFADILAWIESLEAPKSPLRIDRDLASKGQRIFDDNCARCHGTYGPNGAYKQQTIPLDEIGTDPARLRSLTPEHRNWMKKGWLSRFGTDPVDVDPVGYVAPPLDGVWASAPYFHNGSVPTLWHVLHPDSRPVVWKRSEDGYDQEKVGLEVEQFDKVPRSVKFAAHRRRYFDTTKPGKSSKGHRFPETLSEDEKQAVLEYLKSL